MLRGPNYNVRSTQHAYTQTDKVITLYIKVIYFDHDKNDHLDVHLIVCLKKS